MRIDPKTNAIVPESDTECLKYMDLVLRFGDIDMELCELFLRIKNIGKAKLEIWDELKALMPDENPKAFVYSGKQRIFSVSHYDEETYYEVQEMQAKIAVLTNQEQLKNIRATKASQSDSEYKHGLVPAEACRDAIKGKIRGENNEDT